MLAGIFTMPKQETDFVMVNLKVPEKLREEFKAAAKLEGMDLSGMLRQFMIRSVRDAKEREPEAFNDALNRVLGVRAIQTPVKKLFTDEAKGQKNKKRA